jgi:ATP-dependent protease ClpP protease subunit
MNNKFNGTRKELELLLKDESWYNATDYKAIGLVDEIF